MRAPRALVELTTRLWLQTGRGVRELLLPLGFLPALPQRVWLGRHSGCPESEALASLVSVWGWRGVRLGHTASSMAIPLQFFYATFQLWQTAFHAPIHVRPPLCIAALLDNRG